MDNRWPGGRAPEDTLAAGLSSPPGVKGKTDPDPERIIWGALSALPGPVILTKGLVIHRWSDAAESAFGLAAQDVVGASAIGTLFHPSEEDLARELAVRATDERASRGNLMTRSVQGAFVARQFHVISFDGSDDGRLSIWLSLEGLDPDAHDEREALLNAEHAARERAERAQERLEALAAASVALASPMDPRAMLARVARALTPAVADWCALLLAGTGEAFDYVASSATSVAVAESLGELIGQDARAPGGAIAEVVSSARAVLHNGVPPERIFPPSLSGVAATLTGMGLVDFVVAPISTRGRRMGALVLAAGPKGLDTGDLRLGADVAHRVALAANSALDRQHERELAEQLQRALLPSDLTAPPGLSVAARYLAATERVDVGGDWYDVVPLGGDLVGLVIGDVAGHDVKAASVMAQVRTAVRMFLIEGARDIEVVVARVRRLIDLLDIGLASCFIGVLDLADHTLTWVNAGHLPPVILDDSAALLEGPPGVMLGAPYLGPEHVGHRRLAPDATLILYTDGLVEDRTSDLDSGLDRLVRSIEVCPTMTPSEACDAIIEAMLPGRERSDDVAVLVARLGHTTRR